MSQVRRVSYLFTLTEETFRFTAAELRSPVKAPRTKFKESELEIKGLLGSGNFGEVYKVYIVSEGTTCAMKTLKDSVSQADREAFQKELDMMKMMMHENVVAFIGTNTSWCVLLRFKIDIW